MARLVNRGTGAGGANTNKSGLTFEKITDMSSRLLQQGYTSRTLGKGKNSYYLHKEFDNKTIHYTTQGGLKQYLKYRFNLTIYRQPDEAYLIELPDSTFQLKILEKKNQNNAGSIDQKLGLGGYMKREYQKCCNDRFDIFYAFALSDYFKTKFEKDPRWAVTKQIMQDDDITIMFGHDPDYFHNVETWINSKHL